VSDRTQALVLSHSPVFLTPSRLLRSAVIIDDSEALPRGLQHHPAIPRIISVTSRRHLLGAALIGALPLTGCGFRLRGSYSTPFKTLYLQMPENSYLAVRLRQELLAGSDVTIVNTPSEAEAILELLSDSRSRDVLSINDTGRAREYEITLSLSFRVSNPSGIDYMEAVTLTASRDLTYSESDFLSREKEEAFLYRDMEADLVNQLIRRIEAIKPPKQAGG